MGARRDLGRVVLVAVAMGLCLPAQSLGAKGSLYDGPGPRPGPDILYSKPKRAPQLANRGAWDARPILISGASAYRKGEFVYQDWIYDDHGAKAPTPDPADPRNGSDDAFSRANGTYTYPSAEAYRNNVADLAELRLEPHRRSTAVRLTMNTLTRPGLIATTIALGDSAAPHELPHGANATAPAELFLTVHGRRAELVDAASGESAGKLRRARVSRGRNQIALRIPHRAWNPGSDTVRVAAATGLWDKEAKAYLLPGESATEQAPGGAGGLSDPSAFFNVAFRFDEPWPDLSAAAGTGEITDPAWWRDKQQGAALADGDLSPFFAEVDFGKLRSGARDDMHDNRGGVPTTGPMDRILSSRFDLGEGVDYAASCGEATDCEGRLRGRLQPYAIYVPEGGVPSEGYGMTLLMHSLAANYNQFANSRNQSQFGDRGDRSIVITPAGRGPDGWYYGHAGADTFEVWADVARRYRLDPAYTSLAGYSMGGYGTFKFATQFPDLFARGQPTVGPPGLGVWVPPADPQPGGAGSNTNRMLGSLRNIPMMMWNGTNDELVPVAGPTAQAQTFDQLGYRYVYDLFAPPVDHFALAVNDEYGPAADFLGDHEVDRNPAHVTYVVNPTMDFPGVGTVADHAYWLSGLRLRDVEGDAPLGTVDAVSAAFAEGDPVPESTSAAPGVLEGGNLGPLTFAETAKEWGEPPAEAEADGLTLDLENLRRVTVHVKRAKLSCDPDLDVTSDGPAKVRLAGCGRTISVD
jgi:hypothetical protein